MKLKRLFAFVVCVMMALSVPIVATAADHSAGDYVKEHHTVNLLESGWNTVNSDGTLQPVPENAQEAGIDLSPGTSIVVCSQGLNLNTASRCTFDLVCKPKWPGGGAKVTSLRLFEGASTDSVKTYIGPFYRANGDLVGQLIKTFNSGVHYFGIRNDSSDDIVVTNWNVSFDYAYRKDVQDKKAVGPNVPVPAISGKTEKMDPAKEAKAEGLVLKDVRESHIKPHTIGLVGKEPISDVEFRMRYAQAVGDGSSDPYDETAADLTRLKNELSFVQDKKIETTPSEVVDYTKEQRTLYQNDLPQDQKDWITQHIAELGLTQDQYWGKYKFFFNTRYLNHINAIEYTKKHNMKSIPAGNDAFRVTDQNYTKANFHEKALDGVKF